MEQNRARQFVDWMYKWMELAFNNKPKDLAIFVYIYARDIKNRNEENPDWFISTDKMQSCSKFDEYRIKQDIQTFLDHYSE